MPTNDEATIFCPLSMISGNPTPCVKTVDEGSRCYTCIAVAISKLGNLGRLADTYDGQMAMKVELRKKY